jgi:hypothetical protein
MHELLEIILEDLYYMYEQEGLFSKDVFRDIAEMIEKREYEYSQMVEGRKTR